MSDEQTIEYEIIGRAIVKDRSDLERHTINLIYRGDGTPWWTCTAGLKLDIPAEFSGQPGDRISLTIKVKP